MAGTTKFSKVSEFSAFGIVICCVGIIWTIISYFTFAGNVSKMQSKQSIAGFAVFIPIWAQITNMQAAEALNTVIKEKNLKVAPADPILILILSFVFAPVAWFLLFQKHNQVVAAMAE